MNPIKIQTRQSNCWQGPSPSRNASFGLETINDRTAAAIIGGIANDSSTQTQEEVRTEPSSGLYATASSHWSEALQSVLEQPPTSLPRHVMLGGILFTVIVGTWSWFGTFEEVSFAPGEVAPYGDVYRVQPSTSGEIVQIYVSEGELVEQGQVIAEIDRQLLEKEVRRLEENLNAYQLQLGQTEALIQQTHSELNILQAMSQADIAAQKSSLVQEAASIDTHKEILAQYETDRQAQENRMSRLEDLVEKGAFAEDHLFQLEQSLRDRDRSIIETRGNINRSDAAIQQLQAELEQARAIAAQHKLEAQEKLQQLQIEATNLQSKIKETQILLEKSKAQLAQTNLVAPVEGIVTSLATSNVGEVLQPGDTFAEIAPASAPLILSAQLPDQEAGLVEKGMPVNIKFDAFPYQDYGVITGSVISISPDAEVDEQMGAVYQVDIALDQTFFEHDGKAVLLRAGQTAMAEIIVDQRRIISLVLDPIRKLQRGSISL